MSMNPRNTFSPSELTQPSSDRHLFRNEMNLPKPLKTPGRYMPGLDGLRALAVLAVIFYHLNQSWAPGGLLGVGVFFVLSGYLITDILLAQWDRNGRLDMKDFWLRRARRLLPALLGMLVLVIGWLALTDSSRLAQLKGEIVASLLYMNNWWLIFHEVSYFESFGPPSPIGHLWSLAVEEQFYLVWPLLVALSLRFVPRHLLPVLALLAAIASALAMVLIYQPGTDPSRVYYGTDTRAFGLLIGAGLAMVWPSRKLKQDISSRARKTLDTAGFLGLGTIILMIFVTNQYDDSLYQGGLVLLSIATAVVVGVLAHPASTMGKMLGVKPLRWIGVRSYGIYLWHYPVIVLTTPATNADGIDLWRVCLQIVLSIALAAVSWRYLEEPIRHGVIGKIISQLGSRKWWRGLIRSGRIGMATALTLVAIGGCAILIERGSEVIASTIWPMQGDHDALSPVSQGHKQVDHSLAGPQKNEQDGGIVPAKDPQSAIPDTKHEQAKAIPNHLSGATAPAKPTDNKSSESPVKKEQKQEVNSTTKHDAQGANTSPAPATDTDKTKPATGSPQKPAVKHYPELTPVGSGEGITAVGDSVMLDIEPYLNKLLPGIAIDGKIGRQMSQASEVITSLKAQGKLGKHVIIQLGTNGPFSKTQLEKLLHSLGDVEQIILVNTRVPRPWEGVVNTTLAEIAAEFPNTTLVDWYTTSAGKNDYFAPDGVHLNIEGSQTYAALVAKAVNPTKTHQEKAVAQAKPQ